MKTMLVLALVFFSVNAKAISENCFVTYQADLVSSTTSTLIREKQKSRKCLVIQNKGLNNQSVLYLVFNASDSTTHNFIIASGATWPSYFVPINSFYIRGATTGIPFHVIEGQ